LKIFGIFLIAKVIIIDVSTRYFESKSLYV
jgi:hypothetical protein